MRIITYNNNIYVCEIVTLNKLKYIKIVTLDTPYYYKDGVLSEESINNPILVTCSFKSALAEIDFIRY